MRRLKYKIVLIGIIFISLFNVKAYAITDALKDVSLEMILSIFNIDPNDNVLDELEIDLSNNKITKNELSDILVYLLKKENKLVMEINFDDAENIFKDTNSPNAAILFHLNILSGTKKSDGLYFNPDTPLTKVELNSTINRLIYYLENLNNTENSTNQIKLNNIFTVIEAKKAYTIDDMANIFLFMASNNITTYTAERPDISKEKFEKLVDEAFTLVFDHYPEYLSFTNRLTYHYDDIDNYKYVVFTLKNSDLEEKEITNNRKIFTEKVEEKVQQFISDGNITSNMSERQKSKYLFEWIVANTVYDFSLDRNGFTGYGQIVNGKAVCQGYTATYNYMLKLLGIECYGISGDVDNQGHVWTIANLDGDWAYIDTSWGDGNHSKVPDYNYFDASPKFLSKTHSWEPTVYDQK